MAESKEQIDKRAFKREFVAQLEKIVIPDLLVDAGFFRVETYKGSVSNLTCYEISFISSAQMENQSTSDFRDGLIYLPSTEELVEFVWDYFRINEKAGVRKTITFAWNSKKNLVNIEPIEDSQEILEVIKGDVFFSLT